MSASKWDQRFTITQATAPSAEPVTLAEVKTQVAELSSDHDAMLTTLIIVARRSVEEYCGISIINQTWDYWQDHFPDEIELPRPPLSSVTSVTYTDVDGDSQTLGTGVYTVDSDSIPGRIYEAFDQSFPSVRSIPKAIKVRFVGGYAATASGVPNDLKHAVLMLVDHLFVNRGSTWQGDPTSIVSIKELPMGYRMLLSPYRIIKV